MSGMKIIILMIPFALMVGISTTADGRFYPVTTVEDVPLITKRHFEEPMIY